MFLLLILLFCVSLLNSGGKTPVHANPVSADAYTYLDFFKLLFYS